MAMTFNEGNVPPHDVPDYELRKTPDEPPAPVRPRAAAGLWFAMLALVAAAGAAAYIVFVDRRKPEPPAPAPATVEAPRPLGGVAAPVVVPPLDESDEVVRELVRALSSHPSIAAWLATDNLIRHFTVVTTTVAEGKTPAGDLSVLRPSSGFRTVERGDELVIDPRSYDRYDSLAAAAASVDPAGTARLYATLKPRIEEAHRELGFAERSFDGTLERAIVLLLETPVVDRPVRIEPHGVGYRFADPKLEELTAAQKQLLRMGPRNVRTVQSSLRNIAVALGIPAQRLPAASDR